MATMTIVEFPLNPRVFNFMTEVNVKYKGILTMAKVLPCMEKIQVNSDTISLSKIPADLVAVSFNPVLIEGEYERV
ncbi:hypothetical protein KNT64_gp011 [Pseudomonas phage PspYZU05]|uniref:Uncharacterized protein n=1 Tax=Pseudomonas phage PspYZU05 TaxID=1983556 RepID=A0A2U7N873_9CAUD|nr:hypothetical protein KNT64_gp011 [Pseudomonas phage PspYZU05]ASD51963.1 hypothetical protein PspYZU05_11 [Pseudomonas phage PspYZU05]